MFNNAKEAMANNLAEYSHMVEVNDGLASLVEYVVVKGKRPVDEAFRLWASGSQDNPVTVIEVVPQEGAVPQGRLLAVMVYVSEMARTFWIAEQADGTWEGALSDGTGELPAFTGTLEGVDEPWPIIRHVARTERVLSPSAIQLYISAAMYNAQAKLDAEG